MPLLVLIVLGANLVTCDIIHNYDMYLTTQKNVQFHDEKVLHDDFH